MSDKSGYRLETTIYKASPPLVLLVLCPAIQAALKAKGIDIPEETLYSVALAGYGIFSGWLNWFKNHKKKPAEGN